MAHSLTLEWISSKWIFYSLLLGGVHIFRHALTGEGVWFWFSKMWRRNIFLFFSIKFFVLFCRIFRKKIFITHINFYAPLLNSHWSRTFTQCYRDKICGGGGGEEEGGYEFVTQYRNGGQRFCDDWGRKVKKGKKTCDIYERPLVDFDNICFYLPYITSIEVIDNKQPLHWHIETS